MSAKFQGCSYEDTFTAETPSWFLPNQQRPFSSADNILLSSWRRGTEYCNFNSSKTSPEVAEGLARSYKISIWQILPNPIQYFHELPDLPKVILLLMTMLFGWSLILIAHYFPWRVHRDWYLLKIRKRRYFINGLEGKLSDGTTFSWRYTSFKRRMHASWCRRWRLCWGFLCLLTIPTEAMQNLQQSQVPIDVFTPPGWEHSTATPRSTAADYNPYKDVVVHRLDHLPEFFRMPTIQPPWRIRSFIGRHFGLEKNVHHWENFNVYQVQPHPNGVRTFTELHYLIELPNDRMLSESIVLVEKRELKPAVFVQRFAWRVKNAMTRSEFLDEVGSKHECGENYADCLVFLLGELWSDRDDSLRVLPNGALLKVIYSLEEEERASSSYGTCPSESSRQINEEDESQQETVDYSDDLSMMQRSVQEATQRNAEDAVFRLLSGRLALRHLPEGYGYMISLWATHERNAQQAIETRVWLDFTIRSWEERCVDAIDSNLPGLRERHPRWHFYVATPSPFTERITNNNVQLLCIPDDLHDVTTLLLVS